MNQGPPGQMGQTPMSQGPPINPPPNPMMVDQFNPTSFNAAPESFAPPTSMNPASAFNGAFPPPIPVTQPAANMASSAAPLLPAAPFQQADYVPLVNQYQRPPPPPPPPQQANAPLTATIDFGGNKSAEPQPEAVVCAARDPRLKQPSEKEKSSSEPTLADMFKSLDPTASPFG